MNKKIRMPIVWFGVFMFMMLFQTSYMRLGTISSLVILAIIFLSFFLSGSVSLRRFYLPTESRLLILFLLESSLSTMFSGEFPNYYVKYVAQILLCIFLLAIPHVNKSEEKFLKAVFVVSAVFYSILTIYSCYQMGNLRYYHSSIVLFNTRMDPNFIGIPFVAASAVVLNNILEKEKRFINLICYLILLTAIVYTASRGNMLAFLITNILTLLIFFQKRQIKLGIKILWILVLLVGAFYIVNYFSVNLTQQWDRMITFGEAGDNGRFVLWERAIQSWLHSPFFGNGLGGMYREYGKASHNTYFQLLSETGGIGFILFTTFSIKLLLKTFKINKIYFCVLIGCLIQMAFLDAIDNRCAWIIICWLVLLPKKEIIDEA